MHIERKHIITHIHKCDIIKITHIYPPKHGCKYTCARHSSHEKGYSIVTAVWATAIRKLASRACWNACASVLCAFALGWPPRGHTNRSSHLSLHLSPYYSLHIPSPSSLYIPPHFSLHFFTTALISQILITHQTRHLTTLPTTLISILTTHQSTHLTTHLSPQRSFQFSPHTPHHTKRSLLRRNPSPSPHHSIAHVSIPSK